MHVPVSAGEELFADYTNWVLDMALPLLVDGADLKRVSIVGGRPDLADLVPDEWAGNPKVEICSGLPQEQYAELFRSSGHFLLSPGLGTLYEIAASGLVALLQPGASMSMALQSHYVHQTGYPHICRWPWLEDAVSAIAEIPEEDGIMYLAERIRDTIKDDRYRAESLLAEPIRSYLDADRRQEPLQLKVDRDLPSAVERLSHHLDALS
jgi:hypothetical protein